MDGERLPAVPGLHGVPVQGVLGGLLRPRPQGAARRFVRGGRGGLPGHVPQLGLPDPAADLLRVPHRPLGGSLMCRHLAYVGPPEPLGRILVEPPHSLYRQSWAPRRQRHGTVIADGFGAAWYADVDPVPARYRRAGPI